MKNDKDIIKVKSEREPRKCICEEPLCGKCLSINCEDPECTIHTKSMKELYKKRRFRENNF